MKASIRAYAQALFETSVEATHKEAALISEKFVSELKQANALSQAPAIIAEFERLNDKAEGLIRASVTSAHKLSKVSLTELSNFLIKRVGGKEVIWTELINENILGGVVISTGDTVIDMSLREKVSNLANRIKE